MTTTITSLRSTFLTAMAVAVPVLPGRVDRGAAPRIPARRRRSKAKGKDKAMTKTKSGLQYRDIEEGNGEKPEDRPDVRGPLHRLALGERRQGQEV